MTIHEHQAKRIEHLQQMLADRDAEIERLKSQKIKSAEVIKEFIDIENEMKDMPEDFAKVIRDNFWELVE